MGGSRRSGPTAEQCGTASPNYPLASRADCAREVNPPLAAAVTDVAPAPVGVAASLGAPREVRGRGHHFVVGSIASRRVGFAPAHVEDLLARVGVGLTTRTKGAGDTRGVRKVIRHRFMARIGIAIPFSY